MKGKGWEKRSNTMAVQVELPEECWELIMKRMDDVDDNQSEPPLKTSKMTHLAPLSLVCERFLSITNRLLLALHLDDSNPAFEEILPRLLRRFRHITSIELSCYESNLDSILAQIALSECSELNSLKFNSESKFPTDGLRALGSSQMMKNNLKTLTCAVMRVEDSHLNVIADSFPSLEVLDITNPEDQDVNHVSDKGILSLSLKLKNLKTIDLSDNRFITDQSLEFLSTNCLLLSRLVICCCPSLSLTGISKFLHGRPSLNSITLFGQYKPLVPDSLIVTGPPKALSVINIILSDISDEFLYQVARERLPLKKLVLHQCTGFSFSGIFYLLNRYQSLEHLDLHGADFLTDTDMVELSTFIRSIRYINLSLCRKLTNITLYTLLRNCLVLNEIIMMGTNVGDEYLESNCMVISGVKSIHLGHSVSNAFLKTLPCTCPKLECLSFSGCDKAAQEGIVQLLKRCSEITRLMLDYSEVMKNVFIHLEFDLPKLKSLSLRCSEIDDDAATMIGKRCRWLLKLDLYKSLSLTSNGVREVVENCKELMEINLGGCDKVSGDIIPWMVISRPSLKKIKAPHGFTPTESQINLFSRHGCWVSTLNDEFFSF